MRLAFSNSLTALCEQLCSEIQSWVRESPHPFAPIRVAVPNQNLATWLKFRLADTDFLGVCLNVDLIYLERALFVSASECLRLPSDTVFVTQELMSATLIGLLEEEDWEDPSMEPLKSWFKAREPRQSADYGQRIQQVAQRLAALFLEYACQRRELLLAWRRGESGFEREQTEEILILEQCQAHLYRRMRSQLEQRLQPPHLFQEDLPELLRSGVSVTTPLWLFGLSHVSEVHYAVCESLKSLMPLSWLTFNPCREYWEDVQTPWEMARFSRRLEKTHRKVLNQEPTRGFALSSRERQEGTMHFDERDPRLLQWWGRPGREHVRRLCELSGHDFEECYRLETESFSLLKLLQAHMLSRSAPEVAHVRLPQDTSLQIFGAPSVLREVEAIKQSILRNMKLDPTLELTDVAVLVPDMQMYRPALMAVFSADRTVPFNLVDSRSDRDSQYASGVMAVLHLLETDEVTRPDFFALFENHCFQNAFELSHGHLEELADVFESLGMRRGVQNSGSFSICQGLRRLLMSGLKLEDSKHFPASVKLSDAPFRALLALVRFTRVFAEFKQQQKTVAEWRRILVPAFHALLELPESAGAEARVKNQLFEALDVLDSGLESRPIHFSVLAEHLRQNLSGIPSGVGTYLSGGVTFAELHPMRPIPFRVIYVAGLGESGGFPGTEERFTLDLRRVERRIGDVNLPERRRWLFLEILCAVEEKLYFSFVARDLESDRDLQMSSVLHQLKRHIEEDLLHGDHGFQIPHLPLRGSDALTHLQNDFSDFAVNYRDHDLRLHDLRRMSLQNEDRCEGLIPDSKPSVAHLVDFLREPSAALLRHRFGYRRSYDQSLWKTGEGLENFGLDPYQDSRILENVVLKNLNPSEKVQTVLDELIQLELRSRGPKGFWRKLAAAGMYDQSFLMREASSLLQSMGLWHEEAFFSEAIAIPGLESERIQLIVNDSGQPLILGVTPSDRQIGSVGAYLLRPYLHALFYVATRSEPTDAVVLLLTKEKVRMQSISMGDAMQNLQKIQTAFCHASLEALPVKSALQCWEKSQSEFEEAAREELGKSMEYRLCPLPFARLKDKDYLNPYRAWLEEVLG